MECPKDGHPLAPLRIGSIQVRRCHTCEGTWYEKDQLRLLKDREARGDYRWIDVDLWKDSSRFRAARQQRYACPLDASRMTTVHYVDSDVRVDVCPKCAGLWLDRGEYERILAHLRGVVERSSIDDLLGDLREEFVEIFVGPEGPISEIQDFAKVLYLLQLRFAIEHPRLAGAVQGLPKV